MKTYFALIAIYLLSSCIDKEDVFTSNIVEYEVECAYCIAYFVDDTQREKHTVINGKWTYQFATDRMDSVYIRLGKSALIDALRVDAKIKVHGRVKASYSEYLGWEPVTIQAYLP